MENVGKDTLLKNYFQDGVFEHDTMITHGVMFATKDLELYEKGIRNMIWIYSSEERWRPFFRYYINGSSGVILMYDITNKKTLNYLSEWCQMAKNYRKDILILLVGNKLDLEEHREVSREEVEKFKENHDISSSMEISLKTGENVEEMFINITRMILEKEELLEIK